MTTRELRQMLFEIDNQKMTIKELRGILFNIENQDAELKPQELWKITKEA